MEPTLKCPKCGSVALSAAKTDVQSIAVKSYVRVKCLNCGGTFDMTES
jgi:predicted nucleic-acid-binding Zn-ribbon protein